MLFKDRIVLFAVTLCWLLSFMHVQASPIDRHIADILAQSRNLGCSHSCGVQTNRGNHTEPIAFDANHSTSLSMPDVSSGQLLVIPVAAVAVVLYRSIRRMKSEGPPS
ncbi:hypothetical protein DFH11DRAFT_1742995 [Phellopilus nigrolimitatus]|nr:hypothetical protein DFH11DRAFT_1742995 [Phellopilus nigrolimitatus]